MEQKEILSLIRLLDDRDPFVSGRVREQLIGLGGSAVPYLIDAVRQENLRLKQVAEELLQVLHPELLKDKFQNLVRASRGQDPDLEQGACLIMEYGHPGAGGSARVRAAFDSLAEGLKSRLRVGDPPRETVQKLTGYLFGEMGFHGNTENYFDPENSFLDSVLERKTGIPITLSVLCLLVGKRLGLPMAGIGLPCHFIARFGESGDPVYFDPFHQGRVLTPAACQELVHSFGLKFENRFLHPASPREILVRMLHNLVMIYNRINEEEKARHLTEYSQILLQRI